jgi:hypothetical protein
MSDYTVTRQADGRVLWALCALLIAAGFALLLGPGVILLVAGLIWAGYLVSRRTPGIAYALVTLAIFAAVLLAAWAIF